MTEYAWIDRDGTERLRGTIDPAPGGTLPVAAGASGNVGDVTGVVYQTPGVFVVGGEKDTPLNGNGAVLTDAYAQWNGNGAGLFVSGNGTDGQQTYSVRNDAGTTTLHDEDGNMTVAGSMSAMQPQGKYITGGAEAIANGETADLAFALSSGDALLNLADTDAPTFVDAGTYAVTVTVNSSGFTAGGYAYVSLLIAGESTAWEIFHGSSLSGSTVAKVVAAAPLFVRVTNFDGVTQQTFSIVSANVVKLA